MHKWMETRMGNCFISWVDENGMICAQRGVIRMRTIPFSVHPEGTVEQQVASVLLRL
jgi:hypothetical protein